MYVSWWRLGDVIWRVISFYYTSLFRPPPFLGKFIFYFLGYSFNSSFYFVFKTFLFQSKHFFSLVILSRLGKVFFKELFVLKWNITTELSFETNEIRKSTYKTSNIKKRNKKNIIVHYQVIYVFYNFHFDYFFN